MACFMQRSRAPVGNPFDERVHAKRVTGSVDAPREIVALRLS